MDRHPYDLYVSVISARLTVLFLYFFTSARQRQANVFSAFIFEITLLRSPFLVLGDTLNL